MYDWALVTFFIKGYLTSWGRNVQLPVYSRVGLDTVDFRFPFRFSAESEISAFGRPLEQTNIYIFDYNGGSVLQYYCFVRRCSRSSV